jgi:hypothetical protein
MGKQHKIGMSPFQRFPDHRNGLFCTVKHSRIQDRCFFFGLKQI